MPDPIEVMHAIPPCSHVSNTSSRDQCSVVNTTKHCTPKCQDRPTKPVEPACPASPSLPPVPPPAHEIDDFDNSGRFSPLVFRPMDLVSLDVIDRNPRIDQQFNNMTSMSSSRTTRLVGYHVNEDTHRVMSHRGLQRCTKLVAKLHRRAAQYISLAWSRASVGFNKPSWHVPELEVQVTLEVQYWS